MQFPAYMLLIATLLPLVGFGVLLFWGKRIGSPLAGWLGTLLIGGSFLCSLAAMVQWLFHWPANAAVPNATWGWKGEAIHLSIPWLPISTLSPSAPHPGWLDVGIYLDSLTIAMFAMITLVALLVHVFSIGYLEDDARFPRYFTYLSLFCFSMLGLVLSSTLVQLFVFWELVGFCSYLLIGFWYERRQANRAAFKAFVVNRVGDTALLVGLGLLLFYVGNASFPQLWSALGSAGLGGDVRLPSAQGLATIVPAAMVTLIGVCLFLGAAGKSAQFPLHVWLPDAMEGPSPVSALIHAATMVAAGVYLMGRMFPLLSPDAKLLIAFIGCVTLVIGALIALVQTDIKKVLAYSTISQLGYMMLAIGVGSWVGALFHLITHAFFKALLFLSAGSVIHAAHHEQEMGQFGGLWKRIPVTATCMAIAVLTIAGAGFGPIGLSGYHSKSMILTDAAAYCIWGTRHGGSNWYWLLFAAPAAVAWLTPIYMGRLWVLTFWGKPRNIHLYDQARERPMHYLPMMALAVMSVIAGWGVLSIRDLLTGSVRESNAAVVRLRAEHPAEKPSIFIGWATAWPNEPRPHEPAEGYDVDVRPLTEPERIHQEGHEIEQTWLVWSWTLGLLLAALLYRRGFALAEKIAAIRPIGWIHRWLSCNLYLDELFSAFVIGPIRFLASLAGWVDRVVIDGLVNASALLTRRIASVVGWNDRRVVDGAVTGVSELAWQLGVAARSPQTGRVRLYVGALMVVVVVGLAVTAGLMIWR